MNVPWKKWMPRDSSGKKTGAKSQQLHNGLQATCCNDAQVLFIQLILCKKKSYTGVTNYRCTNCLRQALKPTILQKPMNYILLN